MLKAKYYKKKGSKLDMSNKNKIILSAIFLLIVLICILSVLIYIYTTDKLTISEQKLKYMNGMENFIQKECPIYLEIIQEI